MVKHFKRTACRPDLTNKKYGNTNNNKQGQSPRYRKSLVKQCRGTGLFRKVGWLFQGLESQRPNPLLQSAWRDILQEVGH